MITSSMLGWTGAIILLIFYFLNLFKVLSVDSIIYEIANLFGAAFLVYNALGLKAYPFVLVNSVWFLGTFISIFRLSKRKHLLISEARLK